MRTSSPSTPSFKSRAIGGSTGAGFVAVVVTTTALSFPALSTTRRSTTTATTTMTAMTRAADTASVRVWLCVDTSSVYFDEIGLIAFNSRRSAKASRRIFTITEGFDNVDTPRVRGK